MNGCARTVGRDRLRTAGRSVSAAAILALVGAAVAAALLYRRYLIDLALLGGALSFVRHKSGMRRRRSSNRKTLLEVAGAGAVGILVGRKTKSSTHPCGQCGAPIGTPSRAVYCSPACRDYKRREVAETRRRADALTEFGEVPY